MSVKFGIIRHFGEEKLNSIFIKKLSKSEDVVILDYTKVNFKKYGKLDKSMLHSNWSNFKNHELYKLDSSIKIVMEALLPQTKFDENFVPLNLQEEIFMFTSDANSTYINVMKDSHTQFFPFELNKIKAKSVIEATDLMYAYSALTQPYHQKQKYREKIVSNIEFDLESDNFIKYEVNEIENSIIKRYEEIFSKTINGMKKILLNGWK